MTNPIDRDPEKRICPMCQEDSFCLWTKQGYVPINIKDIHHAKCYKCGIYINLGEAKSK